MSRAAAARRLAAAAAYGGGGLGLLGGSFYGLLRAEATLARRTIGETHGRVPDSTGWYGRGRPGPAIKIALLGDSSAAGYGVTTVEQTPGAWLGSGVAERADRRVHLREFAEVGAQSSDLDAQVAAALPTGPDVAVILIGANDVTHSVLPAASVRFLSEAVRRLREAGRRGRRRHLPRPRHGLPDPQPAAPGRPALVAPARGGPDDRGRRGRRPHGLARLRARAGVRGRTRRALRARPVPPLGRRLRAAGAHASRPRCWPPSASARPRRRRRARVAARA